MFCLMDITDVGEATWCECAVVYFIGWMINFIESMTKASKKLSSYIYNFTQYTTEHSTFRLVLQMCRPKNSFPSQMALNADAYLRFP